MGTNLAGKKRNPKHQKEGHPVIRREYDIFEKFPRWFDALEGLRFRALRRATKNAGTGRIFQ